MSALEAKDRIYQCVNARGQISFQDKPCRLGESGVAAAQDPLRWSTLIKSRTNCRTRSPLLPLLYLREAQEVQLDGGAAIVLQADESGIAATLVLEAALAEEAPAPENLIASQSAIAKNDPAVLSSKRRLELSGNIAEHAILLSGYAPFVVDSMDDPNRMRYGFRQTGTLLRAMRGAKELTLKLRLRYPGIQVISKPLNLAGLPAAVRALESCKFSSNP